MNLIYVKNAKKEKLYMLNPKVLIYAIIVQIQVNI